MLDKIKVILEECEKRGFQANVAISIHGTVDGKVRYEEASEYVQCLKEAFGGQIEKYSESISWKESEFGGLLRSTVFPQNPVVTLPAEEYEQMKAELERYRAESSSQEQ